MKSEGRFGSLRIHGHAPGAVIAGLREMAPECPPIGEWAEFLAGSTRGFVTGFGKPARGAVRAGRVDEREDAAVEL